MHNCQKVDLKSMLWTDLSDRLIESTSQYYQLDSTLASINRLDRFHQGL